MDEVAGLQSRPYTARVSGHAEDMHAPGRDIILLLPAAPVQDDRGFPRLGLGDTPVSCPAELGHLPADGSDLGGRAHARAPIPRGSPDNAPSADTRTTGTSSPG